MDVLRACYTHKVWWDNARTISSTIRWYWAPDGAQFFPGEHTFSSEVYDEVHWWTPGAGEDPLTPRTYTKGQMPGPFTGQGGFCGQLDWFANGCPSDAPPVPRTPGGLPACCFSGALTGAYDLSYSPAWDRLRVGP